MSITDELREFIEDKAWMANNYAKALAIADRIDAEHERLMQQQPYTIDMVPMTDERMAEHGWVRKDKERVISHATVEVTLHIDWSRMADELDEFAEIVRGMAGGDGDE